MSTSAALMCFPEHVWLELMLILDADNGGPHYWTSDDMREALPSIRALQDLGFFVDDPHDLEGSFWQCVAGEETERREFFARGIEHLAKLDVVINRIFDAPDPSMGDAGISVALVERGLFIVAAADAMADAARLSPYLEKCVSESDTHAEFRCLIVTDPNAFAEGVYRALTHESEEGQTLVRDMFDKAFTLAIEQGATGIVLPTDPGWQAARDAQIRDQAARQGGQS